ncbi:hypothetical protein N9235_03625 [Gammaproteobacteria bacterium]|nr:hypothetical protein [Gammaproteobacteria bacterium]
MIQAPCLSRAFYANSQSISPKDALNFSVTKVTLWVFLQVMVQAAVARHGSKRLSNVVQTKMPTQRWGGIT